MRARPAARSATFGPRTQWPCQIPDPTPEATATPGTSGPRQASWTPRRHEDICEAKREAGPDALPGPYPGVTPERLRSRTAQTFGGTAAAPGRSSGVAGHAGI